ncbi:VOC family protein [Dactylosporangium sp. CA-139114]|uniref:VOC family protein n=1 Tax=Dactylosporangium sp. CA-139114 TaxID=3239931 RepID=UPI003D996B85
MTTPFVWFDLTVADGGQVADFYRDLFGWTSAPGMGGYDRWLVDGEQPWAGLTVDAERPGRWVPYVVVADLAAASKRAVELGGRVVREERAGPAGSAVLVADPGGAVVALFVPAGPAA